MDHTVQTTLENHLREYSLGIEGPTTVEDLPREIPTPLQVTHPLGVQRFRALFTDTPTLTRVLQLEFVPKEPLLVLAPSVHARSAQEFRSAGIQFLDAAGNAYLRFAGVIIDVRGRRPDPSTAQKLRPGRASAGVFTPRRAQVIFALLSWPILLEAPVRTLAACAKVSVGQAQSTLKLLDEQGFIDRWSKRLLRPETLAEQWSNAFATGLGPKTLEQQFHGDPSDMTLSGHGPVYVSGEQSAPWIKNPETATLYVEEFSPRLVVANRWRTDGVPNIMVHSVFWDAPSAFWVARHHGVQPPDSFPAPAPPLLVYADLKATGENRQLEAAQQIKEDNAHIWYP